MSASSMPTRAPSAAKARARLTAVVLLPTPPLPEATAITFLTPGSSAWPREAACVRIWVDQATSTAVMPSTGFKAASIRAV